MGWLFTQGASRRDIINELTEERITDRGEFRTLRKCFRGNTMYALHESGELGKPRKWICVYLLQGGANYGWGYKDISEEMGPNEKECPVSYLDAADPAPNEHAREWREEVRQLAALRTSRKPKVGEYWELSNGKIYKIMSLHPLRGRFGGSTYKIPRKMLRTRRPELEATG
jgi:hypothetical protein